MIRGAGRLTKHDAVRDRRRELLAEKAWIEAQLFEHFRQFGVPWLVLPHDPQDEIDVARMEGEGGVPC